MTKKRKKETRAPRRARRKAVRADSAPARPILEVPLAASDLHPALAVLRDTSQPVEARLEALQTIQAASFAVADFDSIRPEYVGALRHAAQDQNAELRQRALGILSR